MESDLIFSNASGMGVIREVVGSGALVKEVEKEVD
jgi:hypothetical protein